MRSSAQGRVGLGLAVASAAALSVSLSLSGCRATPPPEEHFYDVHIQPIFNTFCVGNTSPCHSIATDPVTGTSTALGNLDLSSFEGVQKRRDALRTYGSYPQPLLLLKAMPASSVQIPYQQKFYASEIRHSGGSPIAPNTEAYFELKTWLDNGANRDGIAPPAVAKQGVGQCSDALPPQSQRIIVDTTTQAYTDFVAKVEPVLESSCAYGSCHSSVQSDLYLTCGSSDEELAFNYAQVAGFVIQTGINVDQSEILLRPLATAAGGVSHTGGTFFQSRMDKTWLDWESVATEVQAASPLPVGPKTAGQTFFEENVMPKLLVRGCDLEGCHSPDGFNDFRLRSGAFGFFAPAALTRNYHALADEFMAFDTVDVKQSRAVKKNILTDSGGTTHRAGSILEDFGASVDDPCPQPFVPATATRAFCVVQAWQATERQDRIAAGSVSAMSAGTVLPLVFVARPKNGDDLVHFDTYEGGAALKLADATLDATGQVTSVGNVRNALASCAGLSGDIDVRGPEWSYDGTKVVFAARPVASSGLDLWLLDVAAGACTKLTNDAGRMVTGVRVHNFDPVFAPDNTIVFASTRSGTQTLRNMLPNSDLFRVGPTAPNGFTYDFSNPTQMTFLLNSELSPAFMQDGRVSFTAEKATPDFYQLSGRRINWDLTDYHPLLAQRAQSTTTFDTTLYPSVGYQQATEIREGLDRNFLLILSNEHALGGGGALATFNRSIGPFEADRTDVTFVKSMVIVDPAAAPATDGTTIGAYRSPFSLPNGEILASYAANVANAMTDIPQYALVAVDQRTGVRRTLTSDGTLSYVEAALGYKRGEREQFSNLPQLVFGGHSGQGNTGTSGVMHFPDLPVLATLLGANLRRGRDVAQFDGVASLKVYQDMPPPPSSTTAIIPAGAMAYSQLSPKGSASVQSDHSLIALVPAGVPLILEVDDGNGKPLFTMSEEHQVIPGEYITPGPPRAVFNNICGGCHGSLSGSELDVAVSADALTGASVSLSRYAAPQQLQ
jgi:WD40-like Beta Propeller Repeat